ncbi:hypothetical protein ACP275_06G187900 [Erythranthe tilingii]
MSTDLELFRQLPIIKINSTPQKSDITTDKEEEEEENCHTPRSPKHMIPTAVSCPPAPKKRRPAAACKRKLCELQFFEFVGREEIESLFEIAQVNFNNRSTKRNCLM